MISIFLSFKTTQAGAEISTVNPEQYSKRFLDFIGHILTLPPAQSQMDMSMGMTEVTSVYKR